MFDAATERMGTQDPRRKASIEHSKAAERKSNYHQSQEVHAITLRSSTLEINIGVEKLVMSMWCCVP